MFRLRSLFGALALVATIGVLADAACRGGSCSSGCSNGQCSSQQLSSNTQQQDVSDLQEQIKALRAEATRLQSSIDSLRAMKAQRAIVQQRQGETQLVRNLVTDEDVVRIGKQNDDQLRVQPIQLLTIKPPQAAVQVQAPAARVQVQPQLRQQSSQRWR